MPRTAPRLPAEALRQRRLYDGREAAYIPVYRDEGAFRAYLAEHVAAVREHGMFGCSLKALRNRRELDRLDLKPGERVLDAGCGGGLLLNQLRARYRIEGWGVDIAPLAVRRARRCGDPSLRYRVAALERLPFKAGAFDAVVSFDVLEHVQAKEPVLRELLRVLRPGGRFLFYAISRRDALTWHWTLRRLTGGRLGRDEEAGHRHDQFLDPGETKRLLAGLGAADLKLGFLHSFFGLAVDEAVVRAALKRAAGGPKLGAHAPGGAGTHPAAASVPRSKLLAYRFLGLLEPFVEGLEVPWRVLGLGNGFFIRGRKG